MDDALDMQVVQLRLAGTAFLPIVSEVIFGKAERLNILTVRRHPVDDFNNFL